MKKLFSFVGMGAPGKGYDEVLYRFDDGMSFATSHVQLAIASHEQPLDSIILFMTPQSQEKYGDELQQELKRYGSSSLHIECLACIDVNRQDADSQWQWFNSMCEKIQDDDEVVFDFTHGIRSVPIIFATAINFLQTITNFKLTHAYYGFLDPDSHDVTSGKSGRIVDLAGFFSLNRWATAASFFAYSGDPSRFVTTAETETESKIFSVFKDPVMSEKMQDLSSVLKNVNVHHAARVANDAVTLTESKSKSSPFPVQKILGKISATFSKLSKFDNASHCYDIGYLHSQIELCRILNNYGFFMQSFTVMRELIGSLGMASLTGKYAKKKYDSSDGMTKYRRIADLFIRMIQFPRDEWKWEKNEAPRIPLLLPLYELLEKENLLTDLAETTKNILECRNGFDHGWTFERYTHGQQIAETAQMCLHKLAVLVNEIEKNDYFGRVQSATNSE